MPYTKPNNLTPSTYVPSRLESILAKPLPKTFSRIFITLSLSFIALILAVFGPQQESFITSTHIRSDTGDIRITYLGIFNSYGKFSDTDRNELLRIANTTPLIAPEWMTVTRLHGQYLLARTYYRVAAAWAQTDPQIAQFMMHDLANYYGHHSPAPSANFMNLYWSDTVQHHQDGTITIDPSWRTDPKILDYCRAHNYTPSPTALPATALQ